MLPHAIFFETLASIQDDKSPEWHSTVAGLVVLRLVDDWISFGTHIVATDVTGLAAVRASIQQVAEGDPVKSLLFQVVDAMEGAEAAKIRPLAPALSAYAQALQYEGKFALVSDIAQMMISYADAESEYEIAMRASLQLGYCSRHLGFFDLAEKSQTEAEHYAELIGDLSSVFLARISLAKTVAARGNLGYADERLAAVQKDATDAGVDHMRGYALHERAVLAHYRSDYQGAIRLAYNAIDYMKTELERDHVLADLAALFMRVGHVSAARDTNLILASCGQEQTTRWQANINLMTAAALEWQEEAFELYRAALQCVDLPPREAIYYHRACAEGFRTFGKVERSNEQLEIAQQLAQRHQMQHFVFQIEEELQKQPKDKGQWESDIDSIAIAMGERLQFRTLNMA
jgi:hypothetical protein